MTALAQRRQVMDLVADATQAKRAPGQGVRSDLPERAHAAALAARRIPGRSTPSAGASSRESAQWVGAPGLAGSSLRENIAPHQVVLHSDNGSPMKGAAMLATLQALGVMPSLSRPAVSNDNPYSESLFKTLKYRPDYPHQAFEHLLAARQWVGATWNIDTAPFVSSHPRSAMQARTARCCQSARTSMKRQRRPIPSAGAAPRATGSPCAWFT